MIYTKLELELMARAIASHHAGAVVEDKTEAACRDFSKALLQAETRHAEEINQLTDEVIGTRLDRDQLYEVIQGLEELPDWDGRGAGLPGYQIFLRIQQEESALKAVQGELAENVNREAAQDEMLRFTPEDRIVLTVEGVKIAVGGGENAREVGRL